ncbi:MAG TPA: crosslink repair DNA glycosylase YcaQ family protein [Symbiobacteriaceae bacterium]|nr:crosslink repair DNA glycosylase YcaQ family protein [Symbiobacteriaceae bacterium]
MSVTVAGLRRQAIVRSLFPPTDLPTAIDRLGFVQADPMCAPARAQDLILRHRVHGYRAGDLERQYPGLNVTENLFHLYGFMPARVVGLLYPRVGKFRVETEHPGLAEQVLAFVRENGLADARAVDAHFGAPRTRGHWGSGAKATTMALEMLQYRGLLRVARRQGNTRYFEAIPPHEQEHDARERVRQLVMVQVGLHAPITLPNLKQIVRWFLWGLPDVPGGQTVVEDLVRSGELVREKVDGVTYVWPAGERAEGEVSERVRLLAPFDPVVWDRDRFEHLWGWPYRLEAYTPAEKRNFGRYALPMLWADRVIGWANLAWKKGHLEADFGFVEGRPADPAFDRELEAELARLTTFLGGI